MGFSSTDYEIKTRGMANEELLESLENIMGVYQSFDSSPPNIEESVLMQESVTDKQYIILMREINKRGGLESIR